MKINKIKALFFASFVFTMLVANVAFADDIGISPISMTSNNVTRGSHFTKTFVLSRSVPSTDLNIKVTVDGAISGWATVDKGVEFVLPKDKQQVPVIVSLDIPADAQNGEYKGDVKFTTVPDMINKAAGSGASTSLSAVASVDIKVSGDQILEFTVSSFKISDIEQGNPVNFSMVVDNTGNVAAKPTSVRADIYDVTGKDLVAANTITSMDSIAPFSSGDISINVQNNLNLGIYRLKLVAYNGDKVLKEGSQMFQVLPVGSLNKTATPAPVVQEKIVTEKVAGLTPSMIPVIVILLIVIIMLTVIVTKKMSLKNKE